MSDENALQSETVAPDPELKSFLADYERATATQSALDHHARLHPETVPGTVREPAQQGWDEAGEIATALDELRQGREADAAKLAERELALANLEQSQAATNAELQSIKHQQWLAAEKADYGKLETRLSDISKASNLPEDFAKRWLVSEAFLNPAIRDAFDNRNQNPTAWTRAERQITKEFSKIAPPIDKEVTGDRAAVADVVRRGGGGSAPEPAPTNLGKLSNQDFSQWVQDNLGFHPGV